MGGARVDNILQSWENFFLGAWHYVYQFIAISKKNGASGGTFKKKSTFIDNPVYLRT